MADEAVLVVKLEQPISFTVSDATAFEKGAITGAADTRTVVAGGTSGQKSQGIIAREKIASDGRTEVGVYRRGIFRSKSSGAITFGAPVIQSGTVNQIAQATLSSAARQSGQQIIGYALATAADNDTIEWELRVGAS